jgi:Right handed beta helix region
LVGSRNKILEVESTSSEVDGRSIYVRGNDNELQNIIISKALDGIAMDGCRNTLDNVKMEDIKGWGICVSWNSNQNRISNFTGSNVWNGIVVYGSHNHLSHIHLLKGREGGGEL